MHMYDRWQCIFAIVLFVLFVANELHRWRHDPHHHIVGTSVPNAIALTLLVLSIASGALDPHHHQSLRTWLLLLLGAVFMLIAFALQHRRRWRAGSPG